MARLPDLEVEEIIATWSEGYQSKEKELYSILGSAIRKTNAIIKKIEAEKRDE